MKYNHQNEQFYDVGKRSSDSIVPDINQGLRQDLSIFTVVQILNIEPLEKY
jgi:hypothetical protein